MGHKVAAKGKLNKKTARYFSNPGAVLIIGLVAGCASLVFIARAYNGVKPEMRSPLASARISPASSPGATQGNTQLAGRLRSKLTLQPEADRMRRRLGQRFVKPGREVSVANGTLITVENSQQVRISRVQGDDDERVTIALGAGPVSMTWSGKEGAISSGKPASGAERLIIERLALDMPDQFVLAQLRGASYYTIARSVRPTSAGASEDYTGPVWDIVRVSEPESVTQNRPQSPWRLYCINSETGLIERVHSQEEAGEIVAEVSGWTNRGGEISPSRIRWVRNQQVVMELVLNDVAFGPRQ